MLLAFGHFLQCKDHVFHPFFAYRLKMHVMSDAITSRKPEQKGDLSEDSQCCLSAYVSVIQPGA